MWPKWCILLGFLWSTSGRSEMRPNLVGHSSIIDVIPERLFGLPLISDLEEPWRPQQKSLLEPREYNGVQGRDHGRPVRYSGEKLCDGACVTRRTCEYHQGTSKGSCSNGNVCCVFQKSCGGVSREKVSYFRSPLYPQSLNESMDCSYRIYPSDSTCALRIDFERFELKKPKKYTKVEKCVEDMMFLMNSAGGPTEGVCEMEDHTAVVEVQPNSSHPIIILFVTQSSSHSWSLKITHVNCKKIQPWKNVPECGRQLLYEPNEYDSDGLAIVENNPYHHQVPMSARHSVKQGPQPSPYIINGKDAEMREFPWQVSLQIKSKSSHRCGGSIINDRYILTAAHCVYRNAYTSKTRLKVIVGDYNLESEEEIEQEEFEIEKIIVHYNYKPTESHANDIAIIKLNGTITFNENVQPVCLLDEDFDVYDKNAIVSGWGRTNATDPTQGAHKLQKLNVKIVSNEVCREMVKREYEEVLKKNLTYEDVQKSSNMGVDETQLCGVSRNTTSVCHGDSGGPLIIQNEEDGRYFQAGIVSYGLGKCRTDRQIPGSYTNVKKYLKFIAIATMEQ